MMDVCKEGSLEPTDDHGNSTEIDINNEQNSLGFLSPDIVSVGCSISDITNSTNPEVIVHFLVSKCLQFGSTFD